MWNKSGSYKLWSNDRNEKNPIKDSSDYQDHTFTFFKPCEYDPKNKVNSVLKQCVLCFQGEQTSVTPWAILCFWLARLVWIEITWNIVHNLFAVQAVCGKIPETKARKQCCFVFHEQRNSCVEQTRKTVDAGSEDFQYQRASYDLNLCGEPFKKKSKMDDVMFLKRVGTNKTCRFSMLFRSLFDIVVSSLFDKFLCSFCETICNSVI